MSLSDWLYWSAAVFLVGALAIAMGRWYIQVARACGALGMLMLSASSYYDHSKSTPYRAAWMMICILFALVDMTMFTRHWLHHKEESNAIPEERQGQEHVVPSEESGD